MNKESAISIVVFFILLLLPNTFQERIFEGQSRVPVVIEEVDNKGIHHVGAVKQGEQKCYVKIQKGIFRGESTWGVNLLTGSLERDKVFDVGDRALAVIDTVDGKVVHVTLVDHYRITKILVLVLIFVILLVLIARNIGLKSILSFANTILILWKVLLPGFLLGYSPILLGLLVTGLLTFLIILPVYGFDRRSISAISGSLLGTLLTAGVAWFCVDDFSIHGAVMPYAESLLYSGYHDLNLTGIFIAGIFVACSGAMMDVAVDITASVHEVISVAPDISRKRAIKAGMNVGSAILGTMTTTLLLAYSGGFLGLFMVFMAQGTPLINILNLNYVSAEILHTLVGSLGLVTVAPFTAMTSGILLTQKNRLKEPE